MDGRHIDMYSCGYAENVAVFSQLNIDEYTLNPREYARILQPQDENACIINGCLARADCEDKIKAFLTVACSIYDYVFYIPSQREFSGLTDDEYKKSATFFKSLSDTFFSLVVLNDSYVAIKDKKIVLCGISKMESCIPLAEKVNNIYAGVGFRIIVATGLDEKVPKYVEVIRQSKKRMTIKL